MAESVMHGIFDARVEHLKPDRLIGVECLSCEHLTSIPALLVKAKVRPNVLVKTLPRYLKCERCGRKNAKLYVGFALGLVGNDVLAVTPEDAKQTRL